MGIKIEGVQIGGVGIPGMMAIVVIDIADGHENDVLTDPDVQTILARAQEHGMVAGPWTPIAVP